MTREAELELEIARLREALRKSSYMVRENCIAPGGNPFALQEIERLVAAKPSTTALQSLIEKVERRTIERCLTLVIDERLVDNTGHPCDEAYNESIEHCAYAIRNLPTGNLKLEDLK